MSKKRALGLNTRMLAVIGVAYVVLVIITVVVVSITLRQEAVDDAADSAQNIIRRYLAIHRYFNDELKPSVFPLSDAAEGDDYFDARWMSSSYAINTIQDYHVDTTKGTPYHYREAAVGARNPANEADAFEAAYFQQIQGGAEVSQIRETREIDGEPYYVVMYPGERFTGDCMGCHSSPEVAPAGLVGTYGDTAGFGKSVGDLASVVSVRIPLASAYASADLTVRAISAELLFFMLLTFLGIYFMNRRYILRPLREVGDLAMAIANDVVPPGTPVVVDSAREVMDLADAFSTMSTRVAQTIDSLEDRVAQRTHTLDAMNQELMAEISERESIERQLAAQMRYAENLIATANVMVVGLDTGGCITVFNAQAERISGHLYADIVGHSVFDTLCPRDLLGDGAREWAILLEASAPGAEPVDGLECSTRIRTKDGLQRLVSWRGSSVVVDGAVAGSICFGVDITESDQQQRELARYRVGLETLVEERTRQLEESNDRLRRATEAKSDFLANMSHELRTPLNSIIGFTDILLKELAGPITDEQRKQLLMANDSGRHLLILVNDILDLTRVENGAASVDITEFDVTEMITHVLDSLRPAADARGLSLDFDRPQEPILIRSDVTKVRQILVNVVSNAVKFIREGGVRVECRVDDAMVSVSVADTGPGIPAEDISRVFAVFWQQKAIDCARPEGAGLGLAIARRLSHLLGGGITVSSEIGCGSTFTVKLPLEVPAFSVDNDDDEVLP
ncbi:MAG: DUF3365 domain-containing protein [Coriobacteriia bacterium]|nr:DUF3365 domain-containing protein [Coriobacteriia bacterium]MBN2823146.1 DUF3365 domain-containing protein [Coriobacteriia bacterium]